MIRVLLAEDQAMVRGALAALLSREQDIEVVAEVARGDEVVQAALASQPDVAILDIEMPGGDGLAAAQALQKARPSCRSVILTTFGRSGYLRRAMESGTLEQMYLSPLPSWLLTIGLQVASVVEAALSALVLALLINLVVSVTILLQWAALLPLIMLVLGSVGYSLILGGLTLLFKRLEILKEVFQVVVLIFGGVLVSLDHMPGWMATIARFLPLTPGVDVLRKTLLDQVSLGTLAGDGTLLWLVGNAVAYLLLGIVVFRWCEGIAKRRGTLGQY